MFSTEYRISPECPFLFFYLNNKRRAYVNRNISFVWYSMDLFHFSSLSAS